jgi:D-alanyl-D-alanine carboxypeptidase/D-alanyl-D-alanine-endopeptidase (penicillin-binding protein 4)
VSLVALLALVPAPAARAADVALSERARTLVGADQGVYVEDEGGAVLVSQAAERAVHPASVSKVATTLALLRRLGPEHRFATRFLAAGPVEDGVLEGDLVVDAEGDPFFVDENALLVLLALRDAGVRRVTGHLVVRGPLLFDWKADAAGPRLRAVLEGKAPSAAWEAVRTARGEDAPSPPALRFGGDAPPGARRAEPSDAPPRLLVTHLSEPLVPLVKALNGYSNNIFHPFAERAGGMDAVQALARESVPEAVRDEVLLENGAGAGATNRISPRAAVAILRALAGELAKHGLGLDDVLPVSGIDPGTLRERLDEPGERGRVVGKTGTYGDYGASALAGAIRSRTRGVVYFAVLNRGVPVPEARPRQDAFVRTLLAREPGPAWEHAADATPAFTRTRIEPAVPATPASSAE